MKDGGPKNIVASVQARLVERSLALGVEHQLTLARFGGERLLDGVDYGIPDVIRPR